MTFRLLHKSETFSLRSFQVPLIFSIQIRHSSFQSFPAPPRLPTEQQAEFERLQRKAGVLSPSPSDKLPSSPPSISITIPSSTTSTATATATTTTTELSSSSSSTASTKTTPATETSSGGVFRGAPPEFEGDVNPKTGEVGGPKNEPLRWGGQSDWSYNGRVTDF